SRTAATLAPVDVGPFVYGPAPRLEPVSPAPAVGAGTDGAPDETDLAVLVDAITAAFDRTGRPPPRRPWPDPLPGDIDLDAVIDAAIDRAQGGRLTFVPL